MQILACLAGLLLIVIVLWDAFETVVLPRRVSRRFRLTRFFYRFTWKPWSALARRMKAPKTRQAYLSAYGPLSLLALFTLWAVVLVFAFALLESGLAFELRTADGDSNFGTRLYMSGTTLFTLGMADVTPKDGFGRAMAVVEGGTGLAFVALVISYLPVIYQSFSRREVSIVLLDARAGSPPTAAELIRRQAGDKHEELARVLRQWETAAADLLESHISYPVLCFYRSQHSAQSWLAALTSILDACALVLTVMEDGPERQARYTFAIVRHAIVDLASVLNTSPRAFSDNRLMTSELSSLTDSLASAGVALSAATNVEQRLSRLRSLYEPYVAALAEYLVLEPPPWKRRAAGVDDWQTSAWEAGSSDNPAAHF